MRWRGREQISALLDCLYLLLNYLTLLHRTFRLCAKFNSTHFLKISSYLKKDMELIFPIFPKAPVVKNLKEKYFHDLKIKFFL